jgi:hypothetical protein
MTARAAVVQRGDRGNAATIQVRGWRSVPLACACTWQASYRRLPSIWTLTRRSPDCAVHRDLRPGSEQPARSAIPA